ncbi:hypothetical protein Ocin01_16934 [Orchesella cincta]|uniref:Uncharacterized protein n=1 Tax=Orchesella cincta TaxID=48709 RepID=A0A1D2M9Y2_ORCCI|nr:hypothetical protein Ocin01_16934 [Orchesella cincta]
MGGCPPSKSKETNRYSCHREILEDQWSFLSEKLEKNPTMYEMKIEGSSATVGVILHHFYYLQSVPPIKSFWEALELLKVSHQYQIPKLLALAVDTLIEKMDLAESTQLVKLYGLIHQLKYKIQIFYKLWQVLVINMTDRIVNEGNRFDASGSILCVESFTEDGCFRFEILQGLYHDLKQPWDAELNDEEKTKQIHAVQVMSCFKDFVIKRPLNSQPPGLAQLGLAYVCPCQASSPHRHPARFAALHLY